MWMIGQVYKVDCKTACCQEELAMVVSLLSYLTAANKEIYQFY